MQGDLFLHNCMWQISYLCRVQHVYHLYSCLCELLRQFFNNSHTVCNTKYFPAKNVKVVLYSFFSIPITEKCAPTVLISPKNRFQTSNRGTKQRNPSPNILIVLNYVSQQQISCIVLNSLLIHTIFSSFKDSFDSLLCMLANCISSNCCKFMSSQGRTEEVIPIVHFYSFFFLFFTTTFDRLHMDFANIYATLWIAILHSSIPLILILSQKDTTNTSWSFEVFCILKCQIVFPDNYTF